MHKFFFLFTFLFFISSSLLYADSSLTLPSKEDIARVLSLQDYNTRIIFTGTTALGAVAGMIGTFLLLRKRSLLSDTVSHATLPGIALTFIIFETLTGFGKSLPLLLLGATVSGLAGMGIVIMIRKLSPIKDDAALAIVLSVLFGLGISLITLIQQMPTGNAAGLEQYIYGKAASMTANDMYLILGLAITVAAIGILFYKEFTILCFDENFAQSQGLPSTRLDIILMSLIVIITVIGLQAVGLLLVVALLIIPAAAARFWSDRLFLNTILAALLGALSCFVGITLSALFPKLPAGAVIVLAASFIFGISMLLGTSHGLVVRFLAHFKLTQRVQQQHLLRACYEHLETSGALLNKNDPDIPFDAILSRRSWTEHELQSHLKKALHEGLLKIKKDNIYRMTDNGWGQAQRVVRNHRLWEMYLIEYADIAPGQVDRDADAIEHVLEPEIINQLEDLLDAGHYGLKVPTSPHKLQPAEVSS